MLSTAIINSRTLMSSVSEVKNSPKFCTEAAKCLETLLACDFDYSKSITVSYKLSEYSQGTQAIKNFINLSMEYYIYFLVHKSKEYIQLMKFIKIIHNYEKNEELKMQLSENGLAKELEEAKIQSENLCKTHTTKELNSDSIKKALFIYPDILNFRISADYFFTVSERSDWKRIENIILAAKLFALSELLKRFVLRDKAAIATAYLRLSKTDCFFTAHEVQQCKEILENKNYSDLKKEFPEVLEKQPPTLAPRP